MYRLMLLTILLVPAAMAAVPWPQQVATLHNQINAANASMHQLNQRIATHRRQQAEAIGGLNHSTITMLRLAQWPQALVVGQGVFANQPDILPLLRLSLHQARQRNHTYSRQLTDYLRVRAEAEYQLAALQTLGRQLEQHTRRLSRQQQQALANAQLSAARLSTLLETPPDGSNATATPSSQLQPVAGQALPAGEGGTHYLATAGARVVATMAGTVVYSGPFRHMGGLVIIENPHGLHAVYAGLGTLAVNVGDTVTAGAPLGAMPATSDRPRLYFEVRRNGRAVAVRR